MIPNIAFYHFFRVGAFFTFNYQTNNDHEKATLRCQIECQIAAAAATTAADSYRREFPAELLEDIILAELFTTKMEMKMINVCSFETDV